MHANLELRARLPDVLHEHGLTHKGALIKVLSRGEVTTALNVKAGEEVLRCAEHELEAVQHWRHQQADQAHVVV